jgi:hypothetical protein
MSALLWPPIHAALDERVRSGDNLFFIVAPFVKLEALKLLFESARPQAGLKLVCRWLPNDLVAGVSDLDVFGYVVERGGQLYVNPRIHLKVYAFESNAAISTSGNLTLAGLGYAGTAITNVEVGTAVKLQAADWVNLYKVVNGSRLMTAELYARFAEYLRAKSPLPTLAAAPDLLGPPKTYTISSLPALDTPEELQRFYFEEINDLTPDLLRRAYHDLATFDIPAGLSRELFPRKLGDAFRANPFVSDLIEHMRATRSMHFGGVNSWIHERCEDVPVPYKWEIKSTTHSLYNWLARFVPELTWDQPRYSQILRWRGP